DVHGLERRASCRGAGRRRAPPTNSRRDAGESRAALAKNQVAAIRVPEDRFFPVEHTRAAIWPSALTPALTASAACPGFRMTTPPPMRSAKCPYVLKESV